MTPSGIEPDTFLFVAQHLNHCATTSRYLYLHCYTNWTPLGLALFLSSVRISYAEFHENVKKDRVCCAGAQKHWKDKCAPLWRLAFTKQNIQNHRTYMLIFAHRTLIRLSGFHLLRYENHTIGGRSNVFSNSPDIIIDDNRCANLWGGNISVSLRRCRKRNWNGLVWDMWDDLGVKVSRGIRRRWALPP